MLEVTSLSVTTAHGPIVKDLSFKVPDRHVLALFGPSGAGKSTTLHAIAGLTQRPLKATGTICLGGVDISRLPPDTRGRHGLAIVLQGLALFPQMTALGNVAYPLERRGFLRSEARARAEGMLARFQMGKWMNQFPRDLSGGQQQRVALARAAVCQPSLLLLDEPFKGLEQELRDELSALVRSMCHDGASVILVTHEIRELNLTADSVIMIQGGHLIGQAARVLDGPVPFNLPLHRQTIPSASPADADIPVASLGLILDGEMLAGAELVPVTVREIRALTEHQVVVLAEFHGGPTRWIELEARHRNELVIGNVYQLAYHPLSLEGL